MNTKLITMEDQLALNSTGDSQEQQRAGFGSQRKQLKTTNKRTGRNEKNTRNQSALLPKLEKNRYPSHSLALEDAEPVQENFINFVTASRRQQRGIVNKQAPQVRKFFDQSLEEDPKEKSIKVHMPSFSNSQMARVRPSIQSVKHSANRKVEMSLQLLHDEMSEVGSTTRHPLPKQAFQEKKSVNLKNLISPRGLLNNPSKASLVTESYHATSFKSPTGAKSIHTINTQGSPTSAAGGSTAFGRELKHICRYLDTREMQIRTEIESTQKIDVKLEANTTLEELYQKVTGQIRSKLPSQISGLGDLVKRVMEGLHECYVAQGRNLNKKIEIRNKKIEALTGELTSLKDEFYDFRKNSTMDAYFKKHTEIVNRIGRKEKDYMKDLVKTVDEYLDQDTLNLTSVEDERGRTKFVEPSGVDSLLIGLQIQAQRHQEIPSITDNPLMLVDAEKHGVMDEFKKTLSSEANSLRYVIEKHVHQQLGMTKPIRDNGTQTLTFNKIREDIIDESRTQIEETTKRRFAETEKIHRDRYARIVAELEAKIISTQEKMFVMQNKMRDLQGNTSSTAFIDNIKGKIAAFFEKKLGKRYQKILTEFKENILEITAEDALLPESVDFSELTSQASLARQSNRLEHLLKGSDSRGGLIKEEDVKNLVRKATILAQSLSGSQEGSLRSMRAGSPVIPEDEEITSPNIEINSPNIAIQKNRLAKAQNRRPTENQIQLVNKKEQEQSDEDSIEVDSGLDEEADEAENSGEEEKVSQKKLKTKKSPPKKITKESSSPRNRREETPEEEQKVERKEMLSPSKKVGAKTPKESKSPPVKSPTRSPTRSPAISPPRSPKRKTEDVVAEVDSSPSPERQQETNTSLKNQAESQLKNPKKSTVGSKLKKGKGGDALSPEPSVTKKAGAQQDDAPPEDRDDRKELMQELKSVSTVVSSLKPHQAADKLKIHQTKADKTVKLVGRVFAVAEVASKVLRLNSGDSSQVSRAAELQSRAASLSSQLNEISTTQDKIRQGQEMHRLAYSVTKFLKDQKKGQLLEKDHILTQSVKLEQLMGISMDLPTEAQIKQIAAVEKEAAAIEVELNEVLAKKLTLSGGPVAQISETLTPVHQAIEKKDEISEAISSIEFAKNQVQESHESLANSAEASDSMLAKMKRLMKNMQEAIDWLAISKEQGYESIGQIDNQQESAAKGTQTPDLEEHSPPAAKETQTPDLEEHSPPQIQVKKTVPPAKSIPDREKVLRQKNPDATQWSYDGSSGPNDQPPHASSNFDEINEIIRVESVDTAPPSDSRQPNRKQSSPVKPSKKMIQVRQDAQIFLESQDMSTVNEEVKREAEASRFSQMQQQSPKVSPKHHENSKLEQIGESIEVDVNSNVLTQSEASNTAKSQSVKLKKKKNSRIEVFRKTPSMLAHNETLSAYQSSSKFAHQEQPEQLDQQEDEDEDPIDTEQFVSAVKTPLNHSSGVEKQKLQQKRGTMSENAVKEIRQKQTRGNVTKPLDKSHGRKQLVEVLELDRTQTFHSPQDKNAINKKPQGAAASIQAETVAHLRQSVPETDYLKTTSHFDNDRGRADLKSVNIGLVKTLTNGQANVTSDFLNNLNDGVAQDMKMPIINGKQSIVVKPEQLSSRRGKKMNADLEPASRAIYSQGSSNGDNDFELDDSPKKPSKAKVSLQKQGRDPKLVGKAPSGLTINVKSYTQEAKQAASALSELFSASPAKHDQKPSAQPVATYVLDPGSLNTKLMLTQETQTENRTLIKYLLTLINETIMRQIEEQSVLMTNQQFENTVNLFKETIPSVYNQVKEQSDTFFIDQQLGPAYTTANLQVTQDLKQHNQYHHHQQQYQVDQKGAQTENSGLINLIENNVPTYRVRDKRLSLMSGPQGVIVGQTSISQSPSLRSLGVVKHGNQGSAVNLHMRHASVAVGTNTNSPRLQNGNSPRQQGVPFLALGDFSRYGNHTLELAKEIKTRVNLKNMGGVGGGFMGTSVKTIPPM